jgi:hypothetical protein
VWQHAAVQQGLLPHQSRLFRPGGFRRAAGAAQRRAEQRGEGDEGTRDREERERPPGGEE